MSQKKVELKKTLTFFTHFCKITSEDEENKKNSQNFCFFNLTNSLMVNCVFSLIYATFRFGFCNFIAKAHN